MLNKTKVKVESTETLTMFINSGEDECRTIERCVCNSNKNAILTAKKTRMEYLINSYSLRNRASEKRNSKRIKNAINSAKRDKKMSIARIKNLGKWRFGNVICKFITSILSIFFELNDTKTDFYPKKFDNTAHLPPRNNG